MKKILFITLLLVTCLSCSDNSTNTSNNPVPENLIGKWKIVGYYTVVDLDAQPPTDNFHLVDYVNEITFNTNNTFSQIVGSLNHNGTYSVSSDNTLTLHYKKNLLTEPNISESIQISLLNETILETKINIFGFCGTDAVIGYKYDKIF